MRFVDAIQDIFCSENNLWKQNLTTESDLDCNTYLTSRNHESVNLDDSATAQFAAV